jgi:hypothetical protein
MNILKEFRDKDRRASAHGMAMNEIGFFLLSTMISTDLALRKVGSEIQEIQRKVLKYKDLQMFTLEV